MSLSRFQGRPRVTTVERLPDGREVHTSDPDFTDRDMILAVALEGLEADRCAGCGHPRAQAWHAEAEGEYVAEVYHCHACRAAHESQRGEGKEGLPSYAHVSTYLREDATGIPGV